ncbi:hypothetical protein Poli38472_002237 [Pythium oligandrum]|uniref:PH domain-containing protein n=1 Tax=Pythium oligandrum TaxID=41045 RepID=A0A8K1CIB5_PYTOL|nr:hypothetical protein Poli38472_002237 [Pythium oligandrum]|eukprot:TMW63296.1 hypothetical protein Poli38472_002237 [Pythium oligandrum]
MALLFAGRLLRVNEATHEIQIEKDAISFLQKLADPITVVSVHGPKGIGKTSCVHELLTQAQEGVDVVGNTAGVALPDKNHVSGGVWLYVRRAFYSNAKYIAFLDRSGFQADQALEKLLYSILVGLSSVDIHVVDGQLTSDALSQFSFLASAEDTSRPNYVYPHGPKLLWLLRNVTSGELKERVGDKNLTAQEVEHSYLRKAFADQSGDIAAFDEQFRNAFPEQFLCALPPEDSSAYDKRVEKLLRTLMESGKNRYAKGVQLNGPLFGSLLVSMLAHRDNIYKAFRGRIWKEVIHNCCLNIVESAIKLYKSRMAQQLGGIVDTTDLGDYAPLDASLEPLPVIELPCESDVLHRTHLEAKRLAKVNLRTMPVRSGKLNSLLKKLFKDLVESLYIKVRDENNRISSEVCRSVLTELHETMTVKVEKLLEIPPREDDDAYAVQSSGFKRFFHNYQVYLYDLMGEYSERAKGPVKKQELSHFCQSTIRAQLSQMAAELEKIRVHDMSTLEETVEENERKYDEANENQRLFQRETMNAQSEVNKQLVDVARLQQMRKEALEGAIEDLDGMHKMATKQKMLLEEAAFVSVQVPSQKVIAAAQENEKTELQGYLIKQGGGGNAFNPLGRRNWKQRYFILIGSDLTYARTKDDYERGRIIKELHLTGCRIELSMDAGEGFEIIPPQSGKGKFVFERQRGIFDKNTRKVSSQGDVGRTFKLRAQSIEERDNWVQTLRKAAGAMR